MKTKILEQTRFKDNSYTEKITKYKEVKKIGYFVRGSVLFLSKDNFTPDEIPWTIAIDPFEIRKLELDIKDVAMAVNVAGVDDEPEHSNIRIIGANVEIYELYETFYKELLCKLEIGSEELEKYNYINNSEYILTAHGVKTPRDVSFIIQKPIFYK